MAARHFQLAVDHAEAHMLPESLKARALLGLAKARAAMGQFDKAKELLEEAVSIDEADDDTVLDEAEDYHQLALLYWRRGEAEESLRIARKAWRLIEFEPDCPDELKAKLLKHFAVLAEQGGKLNECEKYLDDALDLIEGSPELGKQCSIYGDVLLVKVILLAEQNRLAEALELYPHAMQIVEINRGIAHPRVQEVLSLFQDFQNEKIATEAPGNLQNSLQGAQVKSKHGII